MNIDNLYNILLSDKPREFLLLNENELFNLIPEIKICKGFNQNNDWHIYDVYEHILYVINYVPATIVLRLAALFHDIGKPYCYTEDVNKIGHFYGHWIVSQKIFDSFARNHNLDTEISNKVSNLIYYHDINIDKLSDNEKENLCKVFDRDGIKMLYKLKRADLLAQNEKYHYILKKYDEQEEKILLKYMNI